MGDWPATPRLDPFAPGYVSVTQQLVGQVQSNGVASTAWPAANLAIFVPFRLGYPATIRKILVGAGATATGNFDVGIFDSNGKLLVASGSTAKGSSTEHVLDVTDTVVGPGRFYFGMTANGTNNYSLYTPAGTSPVPLQKTRAFGVLQAAGVFPLADATMVAASTAIAFPMVAAMLEPY